MATEHGDPANGTTFRALLRRHREAAALSQEALAERSGISTRAVSDLERGVKQRPHLETVRVLAGALGLDAAARAELVAARLSSPSSSYEEPSPSALPLSLTPLIGREPKIAAICAILKDADVRLVTLTGTGGIGKTRLALELARSLEGEFEDGARFIGLANVTEPDAVAAAIARALGVAGTGGKLAEDRLRVFLARRRLLLVLDNFEQVVSAGPLVADLLSRSPGLKVLATSRRPLRVAGEREIEVLPLGLPDVDSTGFGNPDQLAPAIQLFLARARGVSADFALTFENAPTVAAICRRVDGLPLAIELAAAHVKVLSPMALLTRLERPLPLLVGGSRDVPTRQQTMRDTIAWSYDLLDLADQSVFRQLSVFAGGFSVEAAKAVTCADGFGDVFEQIASLADKSLLRLTGAEGPEPRYVMLETVREFGLELLTESGELAEIRDRHAAYFVGLIARLDPVISPYIPDGMVVFDQLEPERANVRGALERLAETGKVDTLRTVAGSLSYFWRARGDLQEGRAWLEESLALTGGFSDASRGAALFGLAGLLYAQGDGEQPFALGRESLELACKHGDSRRVALAAQLCGLIARRLGQWDAASEYQREARAALAPYLGEIWADGLDMLIRGHLAHLALAQGDLGGAEAKLEELFAERRALGHEPGTGHAFAPDALLFYGDVARGRGQAEIALARYRIGLREAWRHGQAPSVAAGIGGAAGALAAMGEWERAARLFGATEAHCERAGMSFAAGVLDRQRALGLPEPWLRAEDAVGDHERLRAAANGGRPNLPPIPDPERAAARWAAGRELSTAQGVAEALRQAALSPMAAAESPRC